MLLAEALEHLVPLPRRPPLLRHRLPRLSRHVTDQGYVTRPSRVRDLNRLSERYMILSEAWLRGVVPRSQSGSTRQAAVDLTQPYLRPVANAMYGFQEATEMFAALLQTKLSIASCGIRTFYPIRASLSLARASVVRGARSEAGVPNVQAQTHFYTI